MTATARVVAIEPDPARACALQRLVQSSTGAEVVVTASADAAILAICDRAPDLVLTSTLTAPADETRLAAFVKTLPDVPVLAVPPVSEPAAPPAERRDWRSLFSWGRQAPAWRAYDETALAGRIREALEDARRGRAWQAPAVVEPVPAVTAAVEPSDGMSEEELRAHCGLGVKHARAHRWGVPDQPWFSQVRLASGIEVRALNISDTGVLLESGIRFSTGTRTSVELLGPETRVVAPGRFVRSRVAVAEQTGVKYHAALTFDRALGLVLPRAVAAAPAVLEAPEAATEALREILDYVRGEAHRGTRPVGLRAAFELALQELLGASDVRILREVDGPAVHRLHVALPLPGGVQRVLQATFAHAVPAGTRAILQAAAGTAADVICLEALSRRRLRAA